MHRNAVLQSQNRASLAARSCMVTVASLGWCSLEPVEFIVKAKPKTPDRRFRPLSWGT